MTQDLDTFLGMSIASDAFRVERTCGKDRAELTQLVYLVLADGSELGPYVRKQFETASGVGSVYNVIWHASARECAVHRCHALSVVKNRMA